MADDWKPGDLALCVNNASNPKFGANELRVGATYVVTSVTPPAPNPIFPRAPGLHVAGARTRSERGFSAYRFRKIKPLTDEEREQFVNELNTPAKERV